MTARNVHDSQAFPALFAQLKAFQPTYLIADAGYKTLTIAHYLLSQKVIPVFPYLRYTRERGKSKMEAKVGLTLACLYLKKIAKWLAG